MQEPLIPLIQKALEGLRFGSVQLIVHEGQLVRIERLERIRLPSEPSAPTGSPGGILDIEADRPGPREERRHERDGR